MPRLPVAAALAALLLAPALGVASVPTGTPSPWEDDDGTPRTSVTLSVECVIVDVMEERTLLVRDEHGRQHEVQIPEDAKIKARRKRDFDGLRNLEFEHLRTGFELKLTVLRETGEIIRVKVLDVKAA